jgi:hypothetical protein
MALSMAGLDVDLVPHGRAVTPELLEDTDLVIVLPVLDYPSPDGDVDLYDEGWADKEAAALLAYAEGGGTLVITNSAHRLKFGNQGLDANEDWADANALARRLGVIYQEGILAASQAQPVGDHPLLEGVTSLELGRNNGVPFEVEGIQAEILAEADDRPAMALIEHGTAGGRVIVLADVGMLLSASTTPRNVTFWQNLAQFALR